MRTGNSLGNRFLALALSIVMVLGMLPAGMVTAEGAVGYGTVTGLSAGVNVTPGGTEEVKVAYAGTLDWVAADSSLGRKEGWWVGIKVTAPKTLDPETAKYTSGGQEKNFKDNKDSSDDAKEQYIELWSLVKEDYLRDANQTDGLSTYTWTFDWDGNGEYEQTVILDIDADQTVLKKDGTQVYPAQSVGMGTVKGLSAGVDVTADGTEEVKVAYAGTLDWVAADSSLGRNQDGWWVGAKITAPESMTTQADFTNVTYQSYNGSENSWSAAKNFWDAQDSDKAAENTPRYLTMWGLINETYLENDTDRKLTYRYRFDWNGDGIYEQLLSMEVDADSVKLMKDGVQVYPVLGQVSSYTGGTIEGSGTGNVTVTIKDVTLDWSPVDETIGRNVQGWWVGIKVEAPDVTTLENAKYQSKGSPNVAWETVTEAKSFWDNKDSEDTDAAHHIQLWFPITPASIEKFKAENRNITMWYRFDWDGNGTYEQNITFSVDPTGSITLNKKDQTGFGFEVAAPEDIWVGDDTYQNVAKGGQSNGTITYEITEGADFAKIDAATGKLTILKAGKITVKATKAADSEGFYNAATAEYTITAVKRDQELKFTTSNPSAITYEPGLTFENAVTGAVGQVTYVITDGTDVAQIDAATGKLTIQKAGKVTVKATVADDGKYNSAEVTYTLVVNKADQPGFAFENAPNELTWQAAELDALELVNGLGEGEVTWTVIDGADVATVAADGKITLQKAGIFTIQAKKAGDDRYNASAAITATILVQPAAQTGFGFGETEQVTVTYNDNGNVYTLAATGGQSGEAIRYAVVSGGDAASVDSNGVVTILKAGTVVIRATKPADNCYKEISDTYTLTIRHCAQDIEFAAAAPSVYYGAEAYEQAVTVSGAHSTSSALTYAITKDEIGAAIDEATGELTLSYTKNKVGEITVTATKAGDDCYSADTASYTLVVNYLTTDSEPVITGKKIASDSVWYVGGVTIKAPDGFTISKDNAFGTSVWTDEVDFSIEGGDRKQVVYLKNADGYMTGPMEVENIYLDVTKPVASITYSKDVWGRVAELLSFGFYQAKVDVTITASDAVSGLDYITVHVDGEEDRTILAENMVSQDGQYVYSFTIEEPFDGKVSCTATDNAGLVSDTASGSGVNLVVDNTAPEWVEPQYTNVVAEADGIIYAQKDVKVTLSIQDANFDLSLEDVRTDNEDEAALNAAPPVVTVNGKAVEDLSWTQSGTESGQYEVTFQVTNGDGDYTLEVSYADRSQNEMETYTKVIHVDSKAPVITFENEKLDATCTNQDFSTVVTIEDHNFNPAATVVTVTGKDLRDNVLVSEDDYAVEWTETAEDTWEATVALSAEAIYELTVTSKDLAGNESTENSHTFTIDKSLPEATIAYSKDIWSRAVELLSFGFYQAGVDVTITAYDALSGLEAITYSLDGDLADRAGNVTVSARQMDYNETTKAYSYTFTVPAPYDGTIAYSAQDRVDWKYVSAGTTTLVVDETAPQWIEPVYTNVDAEANDILYAKNDVSVTLTIQDTNFDLTLEDADELEAAPPVVKINGIEKTGLSWAQSKDGSGADIEGQYEVTFQVTDGDGDYTLEVSYADRSKNEMESYTQVIHVDSEAAVITFENEILDDTCTDQDFSTVITVEDHNFNAEATVVTVSGKDLRDNVLVNTEYEVAWTNVTADTWKATVTLSEGAIYNLTVTSKDMAGNESTATSRAFIIDKAQPEVEIAYSQDVWSRAVELLSFGFYKAGVDVTITAYDALSGLASITYSLDGDLADRAGNVTVSAGQMDYNKTTKAYSYTFTVPAPYDGTVAYAALDQVGKETAAVGTTTLVVDETAPQWIKPVYTNVDAEANDILYAKNDVSVTLTIQDTNFDLTLKDVRTDSDDEAALNAAPPVVTVNGKTVEDLSWTQSKDGSGAAIEGQYEVTFQVTNGDGDYTLEVSYADRSKNEMETYTQVIHVDSKAPVITFENEKLDATCTNQDFSTVITVEDHNFNSEAVKVTVSGVDKAGTEVVETKTLAATWTNRKDDQGNATDVWETTVSFSGDAIYTLDVEATDMPGNESAGTSEDFIVEKTAPSEIEIIYSEPVDLFDRVLGALTFGKYYTYGDKVEVTIKATDLVSGVASFDWTYTRDDGVSVTNVAQKEGQITYTEDGTAAQVKFTLTASEAEQFRGSVSVTVTDHAGNAATVSDAENVGVIVDSVKPVIDVTYSEPDRVVDSTSNQDIADYDLSSNNANAVLYYSDSVTATIEITEANFDLKKDVQILDGTAVVVDTGWTQLKGQDGSLTDTWRTTVTLKDEGEHRLTVSYADPSANVMAVYTSEKLVIDHTDPAAKIEFSGADVVNTIDGIAYYAETVNATVTIQEKNFRAEDVVLLLTYKDVTGADVTTAAETRTGWTANGDVHSIVLTFPGNANYTLDVEYTDLAMRKSNDVTVEAFTVDKEAPAQPGVDYSQNLGNAILEGITFGYYNGKVTVTVTAQDTVAGIDSFSYEYILNENVSQVNKSGSGTVAATQNGSTFTASFEVPAEALTRNNQFNGYIRFTVNDRSGLQTVFTDEENALVVDNIAPDLEVTYNAPVKTVGDVSYYDGDIQVTIRVDEANFFSRDVNVSVEKDGQNYPVNVNWATNYVGSYTGTFTLSEDGDYAVSVQYTDRSNNSMNPYTSGQLTLDTTAPVISVTNVVNNSANADSVYTFTVTADDINLDAETFAPVLTAVIQLEDGTFKTEEIAMGTVETVEEGKTYRVTVENLDADAIYTLVVKVADMSGNSIDKMLLADGKTYDQVRFSINRNGSTFFLDDNTMSLVESYYVQNVHNDLVVIEVNADELEERTVTLNGMELIEGVDYTVTPEGGEDAWMQYTYTISKELVAEEGEYNLVISSKDEAGNDAFSDVKGAEVDFVVDRTAPVVSVTGMATNGRYQVESQTVTIVPMDDGGQLSTLVVTTVDDDGNVLKELINLSGDALQEALEAGDGMLTFQIATGLYQNVRVVCTDSAADAVGVTNTYDVTVENISVSSSGFMIFWANTGLRYGVIGGLLAVILAIILILVKRKKNKK